MRDMLRCFFDGAVSTASTVQNLQAQSMHSRRRRCNRPLGWGLFLSTFESRCPQEGQASFGCVMRAPGG